MGSRQLTPAEVEVSRRLKSIWDRKHRELGLTQSKAGERMGGLTQGAVWQYLNGKIALSAEAGLKFARLLEVPPSEILGDDWYDDLTSPGSANLTDRQQRVMQLMSWLTDKEQDDLIKSLEDSKKAREEVFDRLSAQGNREHT